ncbi:MAG: hypothetical protein V4664_04200 [Patescibacteria group bacterium]
MSDELHNDDVKEMEAPTPAAIVAGTEEEIEVPHDEFDALFPADADGLEEEDGAASFKVQSDDEEDDYPFSAELE